MSWENNSEGVVYVKFDKLSNTGTLEYRLTKADIE